MKRNKNNNNKNNFPTWIANQVKDGKFISKRCITRDAFQPLLYLTEGETSRLWLGQFRENKKYYALKGVKKSHIYKARAFAEVHRQMEIHSTLSHRFIVNFFRVFDHPSFLFFVQEYCIGGTLELLMDAKTTMLREPRFSVSEAAFYMAEVASALEYLHDTRNIVYRNLVAENVGIAWNGHIKLLGFGKAIVVDEEDPYIVTTDLGSSPPTVSCSPEALPPRLTEIFKAKMITDDEGNNMEQEIIPLHSYETDWFAFGCLLFKLVMGYHPYGDPRTGSESEVAKRILGGTRVRRRTDIWYQKKHKRTGIFELIDGLLEKNDEQRAGFVQIKENELFKSCIEDWSQLHKLTPPYVPKYALVEGDSTCFEKQQLKRKKKMKIGVYPEELESKPSQDELAYCYFTHVCRDTMLHALSMHTPNARSELGLDDKDEPTNSPMLEKLLKGYSGRIEKKKREDAIWRRQHINNHVEN